MKNLSWKDHVGRLFAANVCILLICTMISSCGGPYTAKEVRLPDEKFALADAFFQKGKYAKAAVEYKDFLSTFAGDERSDYAQFRLAESYRLDEEYDLATVEYRILINDYGYSEYVDDAFFLEGLSAFEQSPRSERDQTKSYAALTKINRFLQIFPNSPRREEALDIRHQIHEHLGKKDFISAKLYFSRQAYDAALIYFEKIIRLYPDSTWAQRSRYYRGVIMEQNGKVEEAIDEFRSVISSPRDIPERVEAERHLKELVGEETGER